MKTKEKDVKKVLVGIDFSEPASDALEEAIRLADQQSAEVCAAHVIDSEMLESLIEHAHIPREEVIESIKVRLNSFCEAAGAKPGEVKTELRVGHPVREFGNMCSEFSPDLVVLGAWGSHSQSDKITGATAKQIIQAIDCDVLLMRPRAAGKFSKVVACIDFSDYDMPVIQAADQICLADKASLEILHVFFPPWKMSDFPADNLERFGPDFEQEYEAVLRGRLDQLVPKNVHGVASFETTTTVVESKTHGGGILKHLNETSADVAVIGARGSSKIDSNVLGRIAERIVSESTTSVYVVKTSRNETK